MVVCGVTVLARLFGPGHHCQVDRRLGNTATSTPQRHLRSRVELHSEGRDGAGGGADEVGRTTRKRQRPTNAKSGYIASPNEIPAEQKYVLVVYGEEHAQTKHLLGLTITVASTESQLSFLTAIHVAKGIARQAGISEVFVCTAQTPGPNPTPEAACSLTFPPKTNLART